ncbi:MAG: DUF5606 domain-containing protein [Bernardetiaceae bacterium]
MELKDIAVISGKPGLYRIIKPSRTGVLVEPIGTQTKTKMMMNANYRVSILQEIAIYTTTEEESVPLRDVFYATHRQYGHDLSVEKDDESLRHYMESVLPEYDLERVYPSDIKKIVSWYQLLSVHAPEVLDPALQTETEEKAEE